MIAHRMFLISTFHQSAKRNITKWIVLLEIHNYPTGRIKMKIDLIKKYIPNFNIL